MTRTPETVAFWRGRLPHWEVVDGRYFVTIHLAGAIPIQGQDRIHTIVSDMEKFHASDQERRRQVQRRVFVEMEAWLDSTQYVNHLTDKRIADMVVEAIVHREGRDWHMFEFVVMPNHVHLFFELARGASNNESNSRLKEVLEQFKRWTGHEATKHLSLDGDRFWQDEWFDHWSRSDEEDEKICAYIRRNPEKARLVTRYQDWPYGSWAGK